MLLTGIYFILALFILVVVHEYGHFQVARWCGVKVLRFSFGFGKILARWHDKKGTEYAWSLFPLGGYVKMLGESEIPVPAREQHLSFSNKPIWMRAAIVLAGPFINFLFAFLALWLVLILGVHSLAPIIKSVSPQSIAAQAGVSGNQELVGLNGKKINSWRGFQYAMLPLAGSGETVILTLKSLEDGHQSQVSLPLAEWKLDDKSPDLLKSLGINPFIPVIPPVVGEIIPDSPAANVDLQQGDLILTVNGKSLQDWLFLVDFVKAHPDTLLNLKITRKGEQHSVNILSGHQKIRNKLEGFIGIRAQKPDWPAHWIRLEKEGPVSALSTALTQTLELSGATFTLMGRLVTGKLGLKNISGPLGIAQGAGNSGRSGLASYLFFLALVSISLGVLNLLPIPLLDGGHLLYYTVEFIRGKPLSEGAKSIGVYLGLLLLAALMFIALTNDISRLGS